MNRSLTLAIISNTAWSLINFRTELINSLRTEGHRVLTVAPPDQYATQLQKISDGYIPLRHLAAQGRNPRRDIWLYKEIKALYRSESVDIAFTFTAKPNIYGSIAAWGTQTKVVPTVNGLGNVFIDPNLTQFIMRGLYWVAFWNLPMVVFQNREDRGLFIVNRIVREKNSLISPGSGVNLKSFSLKEFSTKRPLTFLLSARLVREKGIFEYLNAARELRQKGVPAKCLLLGTPGNNPSSIKINELNAFIETGDIEYLGHTNDMNGELDKVDILVLPSYYREGVPRVLLEGLAKGLPLITTDSIGCRDTVINEKNGFMVEPRNTDSLVKAMKKMINLNDNERKEMGRASRKLAEEKFNENKVIMIYKGIVEKIAKFL